MPKEDWATSTARRSAPQPPVATFTDSKGWYPGVECLACRRARLGRHSPGPLVRRVRGRAAAAGGETTRSGRCTSTGRRRRSSTADVYNGFVMGDGNPTDPWGIELSVVKAGMGNTYALVRVNPAD